MGIVNLITLLFGVLVYSNSAQAIRNGQSQKHTHHPYLVKFQINTGTCSGVRISKNYILTAAHCFQRKPKSFRISYIANKKIYTQKKLTKNIIFKGRNYSEELAIIPFTPTSFEESFTPLPIFPYKPGLIPFNQVLSIFGFGTNQYDRRAFRSGKMAFKQDFKNSKYTYPMILTNPFKNTNQIPCPGDSGGPLFIDNKGETQLIGIVSFIAASKRNLQGLEQKDQCALADRAAYIPLHYHLDFLQRYLD